MQSTRGDIRHPIFISNNYLARLLGIVIHNQEHIMSALSDLQDSVTKIGTAVGNAVTEIQALAAQIAAQTNDPAVEAAAQQVATLASNLQAAVDAATPPAPGP
jgi:glutamate-1-semialdehyde aminotransferase